MSCAFQLNSLKKKKKGIGTLLPNRTKVRNPSPGATTDQTALQGGRVSPTQQSSKPTVYKSQKLSDYLSVKKKNL